MSTVILIRKGGPGSGHKGHAGIPGHRGGSLPGTESANYLLKQNRVWQGLQVPSSGHLTKLDTGSIGEKVAMRALEDKFGVPFSTLNVGINNAPIDVGGDHHAIEVKTGIVTNGKSAQQWRATIGQPGKEEQSLLRRMSSDEKRQYNQYKQQQILERKQSMLQEMSRIAGVTLNPATVGVILSADGKRGDVFFVPGFHARLGWNNYATETYYIGTYEIES